MSTMTVERKLLSAKEVGVIIGRHERTVILYAKSGEIEYIDQGRRYQFTPEQVETYLASKTIPAKTAPKPKRNPKRHYTK